MGAFEAKISRGAYKGELLFPHLHDDGRYVASASRFEIDYIRVDNITELEVLVRSGYAARMSNPKVPNAPSLIVSRNIQLAPIKAALKPADILTSLIDEVDLDRACIHKARKEQAFLRAHLLKNSLKGICTICHYEFPIDMLVAAHLKARSACNNLERRDIDHVVALMCKTGCDDLYERGYISVEAGRVVTAKAKTATPRLTAVIAKLEGNVVENWATSSHYYEWHKAKSKKS